MGFLVSALTIIMVMFMISDNNKMRYVNSNTINFMQKHISCQMPSFEFSIISM